MIPKPETDFEMKLRAAKKIPSERRPVTSSLSSTTSAIMAETNVVDEIIKPISITL